MKTHWEAVAAVVVVTLVGVMPPYLLGALSPEIIRELNVPIREVGMVAALFFLVTALGSFVTVRVAEHVEGRRLLFAAALLAGIGVLCFSHAQNAVWLAAGAVIAGCANSLVQPADATVLGHFVTRDRLSLASGAVGAALGGVPACAGLVVALLLPPFGWRTAAEIASYFLMAAAFCALAIPHDPACRHKGAGESHALSPADARALGLWSLGAGLGAIAISSLAVFFVHSAVGAGLTLKEAGSLLTAAGVLAIGARVISGALADRKPESNAYYVSAMMAAGAIGLFVVARGTPLWFTLGAILCVLFGWGWTGLLMAAAIRICAGNAATAGEAMQIGLYAGATIGPLGYGVLVGAIGLPGSMQLAGVCGTLGAFAVLLGQLAHQNGKPATAS